MDLYLMRHGIAVQGNTPEVSSDRERPLTPKGAKRMRKAAEGLRNLKLTFDRILTSPLLRAQQTAQVVAEVLDIENRVEQVPELAPEGSVQNLLSSLAAYKEKKRILLVGHEPLLGETVAFLLSKGKAAEVRFKKGGLCCMEVDDLPPRKAILHWMLTPRQLRLLAD